MSTLLTTREEMRRIFGEDAINLRLDDMTDPSDQDNVVEDIISYASETVLSYLLSHYDESAVSASPWVRRRATILACYYLSERRGNPQQFVAQAKRVMEDLKLVQENGILIPGVPVRAADVPTVSSYRIDDRYLISKQRVVGSQSTKPYPGQAKYDPPFLSGGDIL